MDISVKAECSTTSLKLKIPLHFLRRDQDVKPEQPKPKVARRITSRRPHVTPPQLPSKIVHHQDEKIKLIISNRFFLQSIKPARIRRYRRMKCDICVNSYKRIYNMKEHFIEHLVIHMRNKLKEMLCKIIVCVVCTKVIHDIDKYKLHLREHANLPVHQCTICKERFTSARKFKKHKKRHE